MFAVVVLDSVILLTDRHPISSYEEDIKTMVFQGIGVVYLVEVAIKLVGVGFRIFGRDKDMVLASLIILDIGVEQALLFSNQMS